MDFIALTLEEAKALAQQSEIEIEELYIDEKGNPVNDSKWRVVNQKDENGVISLYLMVEA